MSVVVAEDDIDPPVALATEAGNLSIEAVIDLFVLIPTEVDIRRSVAVPGEVEIAWPVAVMIGGPVVVALSEVAVPAIPVSVVVAEDDIGPPVALATEAGNLSIEAVIDLIVLIPTEVDIRRSVAVPGEVEIAWPVAVMIGRPVVVALSEVAVAAKVVVESNNGNGFCY